MNEAAALEIADRLVEAAEVFAQRDPYRTQTRQSWSIWWDSVPEAAEKFSEAVKAVVRANPEQLSYADTAHALTYQLDPSLAFFAAAAMPVDMAKLRGVLQNRVLELANARMSRRLQFIVRNLTVDDQVPNFFGVELRRPTDDEMQALYDEPSIKRDLQTNAVGLVNVKAPGDQQTAFQWGIRRVERFLNLLQGCGSEVILSGRFHPPHILNRNPVLERTHVRELTPMGTQTTHLIGYGATAVRFARVRADLLSLLSPVQLDRLVSGTEQPPNSMLTAVIASFETLGEACKPHQDTTRMLLVSSALEMLVGARASADVSYRGQTAAVAERATFLVGGDTVDDRMKFDKRVRALYDKGSGVRHGGHPEIGREEIVELASITRRVASALLDGSEPIGSHEELDRWVQVMRYTTG